MRELVNSPTFQEWALFPQHSLEAEVELELHSYTRLSLLFTIGTMLFESSDGIMLNIARMRK